MSDRPGRTDPPRLRVLDRSSASPPGAVRGLAATAERDGFGGYWQGGSRHEPFLAVSEASTGTSRIRLGTAVAIAFAHTPMTVATFANDLQLLAEGRFVLGLGPQIRAHIVRRFAMPWSQPVDRMVEYVEALRAIWTCWAEGTPLAFDGRFYQLSLMPPHFSPGPNPFGPPPVHLGAFGPKMTAAAGRVADGFITHDFATPRYLRQVTLPALAAGRAAADRTSPLEVVVAAMVVTGADEREMAAELEAARAHIAFYGSTPAYRGVLAMHGYEGLFDELHQMTRAGDLDGMAALVPDELVHEIAVVAEPDHLVPAIFERYGDLADRVMTFSSAGIDWRAVNEQVAVVATEGR